MSMAIGRFEDPTRGKCFGIVAPNIVGTLMAGENLRIECKDEKGKTILFQVDEQGAKLHNAEFNIFAHGNQMTLNPDIGIAIGKEPVYTKDAETGNFVFNKNNATFYVDIERGDAYFRGTIQADKYLDKNGKEMLTDEYKFKSDFLELRGLKITDGSTTTLEIDKNGHVTMQGDITINNGAPDGTFISGTNIYAPMIRSPQIIWYESSDPTGETELGRIEEDVGGDGTGNQTKLLKMTSEQGLAIKSNNGGLSLEAKKGIWLADFATAQKGFSVRGALSIAATGACPSLTDKDGWVNVESALGKLEKRISVLEKSN